MKKHVMLLLLVMLMGTLSIGCGKKEEEASAEVNEEFDEHIDVFKLTVAVEEETTKMIYDIIDLAHEEKDWLTLAWLTKSEGAELCLEQSEEMSISELALDIASQDGTWIEKGRAILKAYNADNN